MTDLNPIIADRFTEHLEVFGKTMEHMDTIQEIGYRCKAALENGNKILFCGNGGSCLLYTSSWYHCIDYYAVLYLQSVSTGN